MDLPTGLDPRRVPVQWTVLVKRREMALLLATDPGLAREKDLAWVLELDPEKVLVPARARAQVMDPATDRAMDPDWVLGPAFLLRHNKAERKKEISIPWPGACADPF